jgi:hypothetical protein
MIKTIKLISLATSFACCVFSSIFATAGTVTATAVRAQAGVTACAAPKSFFSPPETQTVRTAPLSFFSLTTTAARATEPVRLTERVAGLLGNPQACPKLQSINERAFAEYLRKCGCTASEARYLQTQRVSAQLAEQLNKIFCDRDVQRCFDILNNTYYYRWYAIKERSTACNYLKSRGFSFAKGGMRIEVFRHKDFPQHIFKIQNKNRNHNAHLAPSRKPFLVSRILNAARVKKLAEESWLIRLLIGQVIVPQKKIYCCPSPHSDLFEMILVADKLDFENQKPLTTAQRIIGSYLIGDSVETNITSHTNGISICDTEAKPSLFWLFLGVIA